MRWSKRRRSGGAWCPVCRRPGLHQTSFCQDWKCRECGSRIPDETLMTLIAERFEIIRLKIAETEGEL